MKKIILATVFAAVLATSAFAAGEKNKLGLYLGLPGGISYTADMGKTWDLDILAGFDMFRTSNFKSEGYAFHARFAPLFKLWSGNLGTIKSTFSLGPGLGFVIGVADSYLGIGYSIGVPIRFELDFKIPFSLFFEVAPGFSHAFWKHRDAYAAFYMGGGLGLRFRF